MSKSNTFFNYTVGDKLIDFKLLDEHSHYTSIQITFDNFLSSIITVVTSVSTKYFSVGTVDISKVQHISQVDPTGIYNQFDGCSITGNQHRLYKLDDFKESAIDHINTIVESLKIKLINKNKNQIIDDHSLQNLLTNLENRKIILLQLFQ